MTPEDVQKMLDELAEAEEDALDLATRKTAAKDVILTPQIRDALAAVDETFRGDERVASMRVAELQERIKAEVLRVGETVTGSFKQAVYQRGRVTWDTKGLDGFAVAHPEVATFRKQGDPIVVIKENPKNNRRSES